MLGGKEESGLDAGGLQCQLAACGNGPGAIASKLSATRDLGPNRADLGERLSQLGHREPPHAWRGKVYVMPDRGTKRSPGACAQAPGDSSDGGNRQNL